MATSIVAPVEGLSETLLETRPEPSTNGAPDDPESGRVLGSESAILPVGEEAADDTGFDDGVSTGRPRTGLVGWFGRPVHLEVRSRFEQRELRRSGFWKGQGLPPGRGRPALVIPGFMASPRSASSLLHVLERAGWDAKQADVGRNSGPAYTGVEAAERDLLELHDRHDTEVTVIGHSRGGQYARILGVRHPEKVAQVVAVGAPLLLKYPWFALVKVPAELLDKGWRAGAFGPVYPDREDEVDRDRYRPFPDDVDFVSIYSRNDGIVDWRACIEPAAELIEVSSSHLGLIHGVAGISAIAEALARQETGTTADPDRESGDRRSA